MNGKITEVNTIAEAIYPQVSAGISSSVLFDTRDFNQYCAVVSHGTATTASTFVVKLYESSASTWGGAVATLLSTTTTSVATATTAVATVNAKPADLIEGNRYIGIYVTKVDTASSLSAVTIGSHDRYLG
jgi:hypothetical protein